MARLGVPLVLLSGLSPSVVGFEAQSSANPVRKVVNLLQAMQAKVAEEGEKEKKLYEDFICYCKTGGKDLSASISAAEAKLGQLATDIPEAEASLAQTKEALAQHQSDRSAGQKAMNEATALREKEAATYAKFKADSNANTAAIAKAVAALERGMGGGFLQTNAAGVLRHVISQVRELNDDDRQTLMSFLSAPSWGEGYAANSGQITGILKQLGDEMAAAYADATATEKAAITSYEELMATRLKEKDVLTKSIQTGLEKEAALGVSIAEMKNDNEDTVEALAADKKFLANLETGCATKTAEWEERSKTRANELVALADTIQILNKDEALELFKKTLPSASSSFLQTTIASQRATALDLIRRASKQSSPSERAGLDLISLALHGKKIGFDKVLTMIDELVATLKKEQVDDENKKAYCGTQLDQSDDKKKGIERQVSDLEASIATAKEDMSTLVAEIASLKQGIAELDKSVAEATENRKKEHDEYNELIASDSAAKEVLDLAKNRLNKFYNPKLAKQSTPALVQISSHVQKDAPGPPPETFGAYSKKAGENGSVISMINLLITDLDKEMAAAEAEEKNGQKDYETLMADSAEKRTADSKSLTQKEAAKADTEQALEQHSEDKASSTQELGATNKLISELHAECDWLLKYFNVRAEARASEIDALGNAKAVLKGADYSL